MLSTSKPSGPTSLFPSQGLFRTSTGSPVLLHISLLFTTCPGILLRAQHCKDHALEHMSPHKNSRTHRPQHLRLPHAHLCFRALCYTLNIAKTVLSSTRHLTKTHKLPCPFYTPYYLRRVARRPAAGTRLSRTQTRPSLSVLLLGSLPLPSNPRVPCHHWFPDTISMTPPPGTHLGHLHLSSRRAPVAGATKSGPRKPPATLDLPQLVLAQLAFYDNGISRGGNNTWLHTHI